MADDHPQYRKYRSRTRFPWERGDDLERGEPREPGRRRWPFRPRRRQREHGRRRRLTVGRVIGYLAMAVTAWLLVSLIVFLVSAQVQSAQVSDAADARLGGGGYPLTSPNTILVLGSDARTKEHAEPGAQTIGQTSRSDS